MDGLETLKVIRRKLGMDVPIIVVSAYDYSEIEDEFRMAGADAFITKPLFRSKIAHTFHQSAGRGAPMPHRFPAGKFTPSWKESGFCWWRTINSTVKSLWSC